MIGDRDDKDGEGARRLGMPFVLLDAKNDVDGPQFKMKDDPRIHRVGRILRKLNLDDLISRTYKFDEINEGFQLMANGSVARGVRTSPDGTFVLAAVPGEVDHAFGIDGGDPRLARLPLGQFPGSQQGDAYDRRPGALGAGVGHAVEWQLPLAAVMAGAHCIAIEVQESRIQKRLPLPGSLSTWISPPISSISRRVIASPRPVPPKRRVVDPSAWRGIQDAILLHARAGGVAAVDGPVLGVGDDVVGFGVAVRVGLGLTSSPTNSGSGNSSTSMPSMTDCMIEVQVLAG